MNENEFNEKIEKIESRIYRQQPAIIINEVPQNTLNRFIQIASKEDFNKHYGFALKHLIDFYDGIVPLGNEHLETEIIGLREEINQLKEQVSVLNNDKKNNDESKTRRSLDGTKLI